MASRKEKGLGRGWSALMGDDVLPDEGGSENRIDQVDISSLHSGRYQPRTKMDDASLAELAESIRAEGIISPVIVRPVGGAQFEIIAGERRFRAAQKAGLERVPVIIRDVGDEHALAMALIENIQREDLNPLEEAAGIQRLVDEFRFTHEAAARAIGRSRSATSNLLRLLTLTDEVKAMLMAGEIEMGHARALLVLEGAEQVLAAKKVASQGLSVRQAEDLVRRLASPGEKQGSAPKVKSRDEEKLEEALSDTLGAVVRLTANKKGKGRMVIEFSSLDQLEGIVRHIRGPAEIG